VITDVELATVLPLEPWGLQGTVRPLGGGMNSATAMVTTTSARYVAKWVSEDLRDALTDGAALAERLARAGLVTGTPRRTTADELAVRLFDGWCMLAAFVPGDELTGDSERDQRDMADLLAVVHRTTRLSSTTPFFAWLRPDLPALDVATWVRPAVAEALSAYAGLPALTCAWLHTDPAPEAFRRHGDTVGLIDWTGAAAGPALYDVASAVMYLGGRARAQPFLEAYSSSSAAGPQDLAHLEVMLRLRWAVQAAYFAQRIVGGDLTGTDDDGNWKGLTDARRGLGA
jgi:homoserine kinase type II